MRKDVSYSTRYVFGFIPIYDVKFNKKEKVEKTDYFISFSIVSILLFMTMRTIGFLNDLLISKEIITNKSYDSVGHAFLMLTIVILAVLMTDIINFMKLLFKHRVLFIEIKDFKITPVEEENIYKQHHKSIYLMQYNYSEYLLKDLKREKFYLEGKLEEVKKPAFYDVHVLPLIVIFVSGILSVINLYIDNFIMYKRNYDVLDEALIAYTLFAFMVLTIVMFVSFMARKASYNNIKDLKTRILVIDDLISKKQQKEKDDNNEEVII
ncbi:hypothetical protein F8154_05710 [Alkaliphilus pronyensis]|uniref:Uncharacterized protein n=1 Tax=Alkaliphilus pronyensis TaxID=1482732 RepID=A0A6I0FAS3_9FIRM|nr:hypothetical protein [Alkaliphilus pronyensis]KAB3535626.1 hypothetical protein F8154_05710 [Alkaliphilus pronyensis]